MTGNPAQRESDLQTPGSHQPAWLKAGCHNFAYNILVKDIPSKAAALATEAFATAREWKWAPDAVRGGPWVKPTLTSKDVTELTASSKCNSIQQLLDLGIAKESGHLGVHLRGVSLTLADARPRNTERSRQLLPIPPPRILAAITKKRTSGPSGKSGKSGKSGEKSKHLSGNAKRQLRGLTYKTDAFAKAKWGTNPKAARAKHWKSYAPMRSVKKRSCSGGARICCFINYILHKTLADVFSDWGRAENRFFFSG